MAREPVHLSVEYVDLIRYNDENYLAKITELYRLKYGDNELGLIVSLDAEAITFLSTYGKDLFPGFPVIFASDEQDFLHKVALQPNITGIFRGEDYSRTLELATDLLPNTKYVHVISGSSLTDRLVVV